MKLKVSAIKKGTVIDHIPSKEVFKVAEMLELEEHSELISVATNLDSAKKGNKAIIKIEDKFLTNDEVDKIALFAPKATVNIIKDYKVAQKNVVALPKIFVDVLECSNPNCITNHEAVITKFSVLKKKPVVLKCHYCERHITNFLLK